MAGTLNNKERVIDFIITDEGKRQAASGQMKIEYASGTGTAPSTRRRARTNNCSHDLLDRFRRSKLMPLLDPVN